MRPNILHISPTDETVDKEVLEIERVILEFKNIEVNGFTILMIRDMIISTGVANEIFERLDCSKLNSIEFIRCSILTQSFFISLFKTKSNLLRTIKFVECHVLMIMRQLYLEIRNNYGITRIDVDDVDHRYAIDHSELSREEYYAQINRILLNVNQFCERNKKGLVKCRNACLTLMLIKKYRNDNLLVTVPRDVVLIIAKLVWKSRGTKVWVMC